MRRFTSVFFRVLLCQSGEQREDVFPAVAQRWRCDFERSKAVVEVRAQRIFAGAAFILQVTDRHDTRLGWRALVVDDGQQTRLCGVRQRLDIFKHQSPAACFLDCWQTCVIWLHRAKEPADQRVFVHGSARDQNKFLAGAAAHSVKGVCDKGLASAGFAVNQNVTIRLSQIEDVFA